MKESVFDELTRLSLKRELTVDERAKMEAVLAAHPELREQWDEEAALSATLKTTPDVPVSSNFTSRVLAAIDIEERATERQKRTLSWRERLHLFRARIATGFALAVVLLWSGYQYHDKQQEQKLADVRAFSRELASVPNPEILKDFDAINQMRQVSAVADDDILVALSK
jgi:anti-sigma factor RsiW